MQDSQQNVLTFCRIEEGKTHILSTKQLQQQQLTNMLYEIKTELSALYNNLSTNINFGGLVFVKLSLLLEVDLYITEIMSLLNHLAEHKRWPQPSNSFHKT